MSTKIVGRTLCRYEPKAGTDACVVSGRIQIIAPHAFADCSALKKIVLPPSVREVGSYAFASCDALTDIDLPDSLTLLPDSAFWFCSSLKELRLPPALQKIGSFAFAGCSSLSGIRLPEGLELLGESAFRDCPQLTHIDLPDSLTSLGPSAFIHCAGLRRIRLSRSLSVIPSGAFLGCAALEEIDLPDSITAIGQQAFSKCASLAHLHIPDSVSSIGRKAFEHCTSLKRLSLPAGLQRLDISAFQHSLIERIDLRGCWSSYPLSIHRTLRKPQTSVIEEIFVERLYDEEHGIAPLPIEAIRCYLRRRDEYCESAHAEYRRYLHEHPDCWLEDEFAHSILLREEMLYLCLKYDLMPECVLSACLEKTMTHRRGELTALLLSYRRTHAAEDDLTL